jgi:hypothetical protein
LPDVLLKLRLTERDGYAQKAITTITAILCFTIYLPGRKLNCIRLAPDLLTMADPVLKIQQIS